MCRKEVIMKVGDKVWCYVGGFWVEAEVVVRPERKIAKAGFMWVQFEDDQDVYCYNKGFVKERVAQ
jgi:hypothetical protein